MLTPGLFITGTGTGVGKTYVAALIARALRGTGKRIGVYKPVASGCESHGGKLLSPDAVALWEAAGRTGELDDVCPQRFAAPLAPHLAARAEGRRIDAKLMRDGINVWRESCDLVIVEGAGGLMSPISDDDYNADLACEFGYPLIVVAANELGTINATLQTLITASSVACGSDADGEEPRATGDGGLSVAGIVLNSPRTVADDPSTDSNADEIARRCVAPLLAVVEYGGELSGDVDWGKLCARMDG